MAQQNDDKSNNYEKEFRTKLNKLLIEMDQTKQEKLDSASFTAAIMTTIQDTTYDTTSIANQIFDDDELIKDDMQNAKITDIIEYILNNQNQQIIQFKKLLSNALKIEEPKTNDNANNNDNDVFIDEGGWAEAKTKCPHVAESVKIPSKEKLKELADLVTNPVCSIPDCDKKECWFCLSTHKLFCGRYANNHMSIHYESSENKSNCVAMGVGDLSFWCYKCDSYLNHLTIKPIFEVYEIAHIAKFGESIPDVVLKETNFGNDDDDDDGKQEQKKEQEEKETKKKVPMISKKKKKKKKDKKKDGKQENDDDGDTAMDDYNEFMKDRKYNEKVDYLDHSVDDKKFDGLMKEVMDNKNEQEIEWMEDENLPNINPILSNLHHRKLFVGRLENDDDDNDGGIGGGMFGMFFASRNGLSGYSLFDKIPSKLKLLFVKLGIDKNVYLNRAMASVIGMGIGDATGAPLEFIPCVDQYETSYFKLKGKKKWINEQNAFSLKRGQWTDDASMGLCMADSLILNKQYNGSDIRIRFWNWWNNGYCNAFRLDPNNHSKSSVGLGGNISKSIYSMKDGEIPTPEFITYTSKDDSGNGSLMRLSPIPVFFSHCQGNKQLIDIAMDFAKKSSFTTHPGYIAAEACALMSYIIIHAIHRPDDTQNDGKDEEEKDGMNDEKMFDNFGIKSYKNVRVFLEDMTDKYLKRIQRENDELKNTLKELIKSKEYKYVKNKVEAMQQRNMNNDSAFDEDNDDEPGQGHDELTEKFLKDEDDDGNDHEMYERVNSQDVYIKTAWNNIQEKLNHIHRQLVAQLYIIRLIKSEEPDDSTERCWNWKCKYGDLGIDKTMVNRGSNYNGYPNTQGYFGSYCMDGLAMGLHSLYNSTSFGDAVMKAVNMLGDADSTGSITGQMAGAWYGFTDVFYDKQGEQFLFKQLSKWDDYEFGVRAVCLFKIGKDFAGKLKQQLKEREKQLETQKGKEEQEFDKMYTKEDNDEIMENDNNNNDNENDAQ